MPSRATSSRRPPPLHAPRGAQTPPPPGSPAAWPAHPQGETKAARGGFKGTAPRGPRPPRNGAARRSLRAAAGRAQTHSAPRQAGGGAGPRGGTGNGGGEETRSVWKNGLQPPQLANPVRARLIPTTERRPGERQARGGGCARASRGLPPTSRLGSRVGKGRSGKRGAGVVQGLGGAS